MFLSVGLPLLYLYGRNLHIGHEAVMWSLSILLPSITVLFGAEACRWFTEQFIHYQRLREVFFVLELAYTTFREKPWQLYTPLVDFHSRVNTPGGNR